MKKNMISREVVPDDKCIDVKRSLHSASGSRPALLICSARSSQPSLLPSQWWSCQCAAEALQTTWKKIICIQ